jgi:hypothetical protein
MLLVINFVAFQIAWLSSVVGGAQQMPWLGPVAVMIALALHLKAARKPFEELLLVLACAVIGAAFDSILVAAGWVAYTSGQFSDFIAPYWIITMWMLFATTLNVSMALTAAPLRTLPVRRLAESRWSARCPRCSRWPSAGHSSCPF